MRQRDQTFHPAERGCVIHLIRQVRTLAFLLLETAACGGRSQSRLCQGEQLHSDPGQNTDVTLTSALKERRLSRRRMTPQSE